MKTSTINKTEINKFDKLAAEWWNPEGSFKPLHKFNPIRIKYIKENIIRHFKIKSKNIPLKNINIVNKHVIFFFCPSAKNDIFLSCIINNFKAKVLL